VQVLGVEVDALDRAGLLDAVAARVDAGGWSPVAYVNLHVLDVAGRDPELTAFLRDAALVVCDGEGVRAAARVLGRSLPARHTGADWAWDLAVRARDRGWRLAWIGGAPGVADAACAALRAHAPGLVTHAEHGFHGDDADVVSRVRAFRAQVVLVGMGTPLQERWIARHGPSLGAPVVWAVGAAADFVSGRTPRGPAWLHTRQEWLARLLHDPRRLWRRYLLGHARVGLRVLVARFHGAGGSTPRNAPRRVDDPDILA
jgi:N-acetylglucosaminyldiphosphoundecaprenol N-acetyl-beta-D-mannosaminyltransferase